MSTQFVWSPKPPPGVGCEYGIKGKRDAMEDTSAYAQWTCRGDAVELFGIFDGHGGGEASKLVGRILPQLIAARYASTVPGTALSRAFRDMQSYMQAFYPEKFQKQGTTAVVVLRVGRTLYCANAGDSRAVLCPPGNRANVALSRDHKPNQRAEKERIRRLGGYVNLPSRGTPRVWKSRTDEGIGLSTSRSLGDLDSRMPTGEYLVSPVPDVAVHTPNPGSLLILACDGVWDVVSSAEACQIVKSSTPAAACKNLVRHAFAKGSADNISAMVVGM